MSIHNTLTVALTAAIVAFELSAQTADLVGKEFDTEAWPGRMPAEEMREAAPLIAEVEKAMLAVDKDGVMAAVAKLRETLGPYAGVPESQPQYVTPIDDSTPDLDKVVELWRGSFERLKGRNAWERAAPLDAEQQTTACAPPFAPCGRICNPTTRGLKAARSSSSTPKPARIT